MSPETEVKKASIICTGYSLKGFDFDKIQGTRIAVNYAYKYFDYDLLMAFDDPIKYGFPVDERLHTNLIWKKKYKLENCNVWDRIKSIKGIGRSGIQIFGGSGSLFCGIDVALRLGYNHLDVYGADMKLTDGYCHFYDEQPETDKARIDHYNASFGRHQATKAIFMSQLQPHEKINWIDVYRD